MPWLTSTRHWAAGGINISFRKFTVRKSNQNCKTGSLEREPLKSTDFEGFLLFQEISLSEIFESLLCQRK
jgi:hypothetical protein